jgi:hypothetical protein
MNDENDYFDRGASNVSTVKVIEHPDVPGTPLRIDESQFDPNKHTEWTGGENGAQIVNIAGNLPVLPDVLNVVKDGKRFFVTDADGNRVDDQRFDANGYGTETDAWAVIGTVQAASNG